MSKCRCKKDHAGQEEVDVERIIDKHTQQVADEIDREIFEDIIAMADPLAIAPSLKERK